MALTVLELIQSACYAAGITAPSAVVGETAVSTLKLLNLFYETGRDLRQSRCWSQLKRRHVIELKAGRNQYHLPEDFYAAIPQTHWDQQNNWEMFGPSSDDVWAYRTYGYATLENRKAYRVFGPALNPNDARGQFYINPAVSSTEDGAELVFEYISRSWLLPPHWTASTALTGSIYRNASGNNYLLSTNGTTGTVAPNMANGVGQDGGVFWKHLTVSAWGTSTAYAQGTYVTNGGNLYKCTVSGTSAGSGGPTGTDTTTAVTDNTCSWLYISESAWAAYTSYAVGAHVTNSSKRYRAVKSPHGSSTQKSGAAGPDWTATTVPDNTAGWTYQTASYEQLQTDSDLCLFDEDLMILGLQWRFMRGKNLPFQSKQAEYIVAKDAAAARWQPGSVLSMAASPVSLSGLNPNLRDGNFGNV